jgi:hypothetical protein
MIMTYNFVFMAQRDNRLMEKIENALISQSDKIIYTEIHKLFFSTSKQSLRVYPCSEDSIFCKKTVPKEIKYSAVRKMIDGKWEEISKDEIMDIDKKNI